MIYGVASCVMAETAPTPSPAQRASVLRERAQAVADASPYEAEALEALARSWENCADMPTDEQAAYQHVARAKRDYLLKCTEFALRDAQVFATLHLASVQGQNSRPPYPDGGPY
jgi:hypothetical protein